MIIPFPNQPQDINLKDLSNQELQLIVDSDPYSDKGVAAFSILIERNSQQITKLFEEKTSKIIKFRES